MFTLTSAGPLGGGVIAGSCSPWGAIPSQGRSLPHRWCPIPHSTRSGSARKASPRIASAQKVGDDIALSGLVSADEPPALALLDLSLLDGRFDPELIATELARLLEAWEEAVTGSEAPLEELATAHARTTLLRPRPGTRLVLRDAVLKSWEPTRLELARQPRRSKWRWM